MSDTSGGTPELNQNQMAIVSPVSDIVEPGLFYFQGRIGRRAFGVRLIVAFVLYVLILLANLYLLGDGNAREQDEGQSQGSNGVNLHGVHLLVIGGLPNRPLGE